VSHHISFSLLFSPFFCVSSALPQGTRLKVKRIDKVRNPQTGKWDIVENDEPEPVTGAKSNGKYAEYAEYAFVARRKLQQSSHSDFPTITTKILIQSDLLLRVVREVLKDVQRLSWNPRPFKVMWLPLSIATEVIKIHVQVDPQLLLAFLPRFKDYLADLRSKDIASDDDRMTEHLSFLINFLDTEYATTIRKVNDLISHGEITFDLLWAILLPHSVIFTMCKTTTEPRAVRLRHSQRVADWTSIYWHLSCDYINAIEDPPSPCPQFGLANISLNIQSFDGVVKISELSSYPIKFHPNGDVVREKLITRGGRWIELNGVQHVHYNGVAYRGGGTITKLTVSFISNTCLPRGTLTASTAR
jgi:hypothetical protein